MSWYNETAVRTGPLNYLVGTHLSPAGRLGELLRNSFPAGSSVSVNTVAATERLAARLRAGGADRVLVSAGLHAGYLDLDLFGTDQWQVAQALPGVIGSIEDPVLLRSAAGWSVLLPISVDRLTLPLTAVPVADLGGLLDDIAAAQPLSVSDGAVRLGLTAHQLISALSSGSPHPLLTAKTTQFDLTFPAGTDIAVIAQLAARRPRLHRLDVHLDPGMITVAKASLLATIAGQVEELSFYWNPADDDVVRSTILPQIALAYRDNAAFTGWAAELERQLLLPFDILAVQTPTEAAGAIVASSIQDIPGELIGTEMVIYAPATLPDLGQRDVSFEGPALHNATAMRVGAHRLQLLPYGAERPAGNDPAVRHLGSAVDLAAFLADAETARTVGVWASAAAELENDARFLHSDRPSTAPSPVLFCDAAGTRTTRLLPGPAGPPPVGSVDTHRLGGYVTALRLRRRFGTEITISGFPAAQRPSGPAAPRWLVGRLAGPAGQLVLAEIGYGRRVFQVPEWLAALVESVQDGADRVGAVAAAAELAGTTSADCERLLLELAA